ncbi:MAG: hypothetical protein OXB92_08860 [Acidimicrobiaceae bacterium]|nr:hypothetical protein [Acidimicrobiaceae bacterium]
MNFHISDHPQRSVVSSFGRVNRHRFVLLWCFAVVSLLAEVSPAAAVAGFGDVADSQYYTGPVQWSVDNDITTARLKENLSKRASRLSSDEP